MKIWSYLWPEQIFLDVELPSKEAVLRFAADTFARQGLVRNSEGLYSRMLLRENILSTGIGNGIGIPHTTSPDAQGGALLLIRLARTIDFDSIDALPVDIVLALLAPGEAPALHLQILAGISRLCRNPHFLQTARNVANARSLLEVIKELEEQ